jgi:hypothetical protein
MKSASSSLDIVFDQPATEARAAAPTLVPQTVAQLASPVSPVAEGTGATTKTEEVLII